MENITAGNSAVSTALSHPQFSAWRARRIFCGDHPYFAAQSSTPRFSVRPGNTIFDSVWTVRVVRPLTSLSYVGSGGFSKSRLFPGAFLPVVRWFDALFSRWPRLFATRLLVVLEKNGA